MGIFDRFKRMLKSNLNDLITKSEDPEKMLNQLISDMNQQLIESKKSVASAIADEKKLERQVNDTKAQAEEWERKAMVALRAGKEDLAREALERKQEMEKYAEQYEEQWQQQHESVEKLKSSLRGLQQKIEEAHRKKNLLVARSKRAEAQKRIQEMVGGMSDTSAFEAFEKMSERMDRLEAENAAMEEISGWDKDESIEEQFKQLEGSGASTDTMLDDLRKRMAIEDQSGGTQGQAQDRGEQQQQSGKSDRRQAEDRQGDHGRQGERGDQSGGGAEQGGAGEGQTGEQPQADPDEVEATLEELKKRMQDDEG